MHSVHIIIILFIHLSLVNIGFTCRSSGKDSSSEEKSNESQSSNLGTTIALTQKCFKFNTSNFYPHNYLSYSCTTSSSLELFNSFINAAGQRSLNTSMAIPDRNCKCRERLIEAFYRFTLPECKLTNDGEICYAQTTQNSTVLMPCSDYCQSLLEGCVGDPPPTFITEVFTKMLGNNVTEVCNNLPNSSCWSRSYNFTSCADPLPITTKNTEASQYAEWATTSENGFHSQEINNHNVIIVACCAGGVIVIVLIIVIVVKLCCCKRPKIDNTTGECNNIYENESTCVNKISFVKLGKRKNEHYTVFKTHEGAAKNVGSAPANLYDHAISEGASKKQQEKNEYECIDTGGNLETTFDANYACAEDFSNGINLETIDRSLYTVMHKKK